MEGIVKIFVKLLRKKSFYDIKYHRRIIYKYEVLNNE